MNLLKETYYRQALKSQESQRIKQDCFDRYLKENIPKLKKSIKVQFALLEAAQKQGRELSEAERRTIVYATAEQLAQENFDEWYKLERIRLEEEWIDRILAQGVPELNEIVGLPNIFEALGHSRASAKDSRMKERLKSDGIMRKCPDGKWRALKAVCDAYKKNRKKNKK